MATLTTRVTLTFCGPPVVPDGVMVTVPLYVPATRPVGTTATLTVPGVVPLVGVAANHGPPVDVAV